MHGNAVRLHYDCTVSHGFIFKGDALRMTRALASRVGALLLVTVSDTLRDYGGGG